MENKGCLNDKVALITGAGSGIGRAIAVAFAQEGASVGINFHKNKAGAEETLSEINNCQADGLLLGGDVSSEEDIKRIVKEIIDKFGKIDIVVNNSGIGASNSPDRVVDILPADWDRVMVVNLKSIMLMGKYVIPHMIENGGGAIVNISSIRGLIGNPNLASYCASKGGVNLLTKEMALDYAKAGIRVNSIAPGFINSEMFKSYIAKQVSPEKALKNFENMAPLKRIGLPEEIADAAVFLVGPDSSFITGVVLPVDGGYTANGVRTIL